MAVKFASGKVKTLSYAWLCDASGDVTIPVLNHAGYSLTAVETVPGLNGDLATTLPTSYDVLINDEFSFSITETELSSRSASIAETIYADLMVPILGELSIVISNAGNAKTGLILLFLERKSH